MNAADAGHVPAEEGDRPWERPGCFRLDCEPDRSRLLVLLGAASVWCGVLALCCYGLTGLAGLPAGVTAWVMAKRDLREIAAGRMDPTGERRTWLALDLAQCGVMSSLFSPLLTAAFHLWVWASGIDIL